MSVSTTVKVTASCLAILVAILAMIAYHFGGVAGSAHTTTTAGMAGGPANTTPFLAGKPELWWARLGQL